MTEIEKQILEHIKAIRGILEANGGVQHLTMSIGDNGTIRAHNAYWELPQEKKIKIFAEGENYTEAVKQAKLEIEEENEDDR